MKAKLSAKWCLVFGLAIAVTGLVGPAMAQDELYLSSSEPKGLSDMPLATGGQSEEDMAPEATLPQTSLRLAGVAFKPRVSSVGWAYSGGGSVYASSGSSSEVWTATFYLPQGSVVGYIRMYYYDTSASNCAGYFTLYGYDGTLVDEWSVTSSGTGGFDYADSDPINHTINYSACSYVLNWRPSQIGNSMRLYGFRIFYYPSGTRYGSAMILSSPPP
jgi:hypothetical protein